MVWGLVVQTTKYSQDILVAVEFQLLCLVLHLFFYLVPTSGSVGCGFQKYELEQYYMQTVGLCYP